MSLQRRCSNKSCFGLTGRETEWRPFTVGDEGDKDTSADSDNENATDVCGQMSVKGLQIKEDKCKMIRIKWNWNWVK